jgi:hypothetical protein
MREGKPQEAPKGLRRFFIVGGPATNAQDLARLLDKHPKIACTSNLYMLDPGPRSADGEILNPFNPKSKRTEAHGFSKETRERVWKCYTDAKASKFLEEMTLTIRRPYQLLWAFRQAMDILGADFAERRQAEAIGDCWEWYWHFDVLLEAFPGTVLFYVHRNPHEVWSRMASEDIDLANAALTRMLDGDDRLRACGVPATLVPYDAIKEYPEVVLKTCLSRLGLEHEELIGPDPWPDSWVDYPEGTRELEDGTFKQITRHCLKYLRHYQYPLERGKVEKVGRGAHFDVFMDFLKGKKWDALEVRPDDPMTVEERIRNEATILHDSFAHLNTILTTSANAALKTPEKIMTDTVLDKYQRGYRAGRANELANNNIRLNDMLSANRLFMKLHPGQVQFELESDEIQIQAVQT